jgi:Ni/Co efflux regulator RcnB
MNKLLCAVSILALAIPAVAVAQQQNDKQKAEHANRPQNGGQHAAHPGNGHGQPGQAQPNRSSGPQARPAAEMQMQHNHPNHSNLQGRSPSGERAAIQPAPSRPTSNRPGARPANIRRVQAAPFRYPHGYQYRRWNAGLILPSIFLSNYYFYNNWSMVGAYPPPPGFVWVRYGPDLLLVSRHSGRIRDVIYNVFY